MSDLSTQPERLRRGLLKEAESRHIDPPMRSHYCLGVLSALTTQLSTGGTREKRAAKRQIDALIEAGKEVAA